MGTFADLFQARLPFIDEVIREMLEAMGPRGDGTMPGHGGGLTTDNDDWSAELDHDYYCAPRGVARKTWRDYAQV